MENDAVAKTLDIRLWIDLTGGGNASEARMRRVVNKVRQAALDALEEETLTPQGVGGDWALNYTRAWDDIAPPKGRGRRLQ
ncbi:hypothetical protein [Micromonospora endolithica]|uniref:Uncharacterized protein n=1 Tax=Micromonospora endolithica TaxID=230091 RepID=A0A3A9YW17_9ACTN|nr:hypothetical protein [Micromonospora endolithica]RKN39979.1 hypothetical protein D7223_27995 [Micromonospora endolithica]TWJ26150.1 hypothetical protein JD76_06330 [Micromonospora endolithica]